MGVSFASLLVAPAFKKYKAKNVMALNIFLNSFFCALFGYFHNLFFLYFCRFMMGFSQAFCVIYAPVWINEFSPSHSSTLWMGMLHSFVPLGKLEYFKLRCLICI